MIPYVHRFKVNSRVYYIYSNRLHTGIVKGEYKLDDLNYRYLVQGSKSGESRWLNDGQLYKSLSELISDLKSLVID